MATVYSRIFHLQEEEKIPFRFNPVCTTKIGRRVKEKWSEKYDAPPSLTSSVEKHGTFLVFDYPDSFIPDIDTVIDEYIQTVLKKRRERIAATPTAVQEPPQEKAPIDPTTLRKRKRTPKKVTQPVYKASHTSV
jgi:hypothetical protein